VASTATPTVESATATPTPKPLTGPRATAEALSKKVTVVPAATASGGKIAADDYAAIFERAWQIVADNYVRDNFNGVDWEDVREAYRPRFEAVDDQEAFWDLMEVFIGELQDDHSRFVRPDRLDAEFDLSPPDDATGALWTGLEIWPAREDERLKIWYVCERGPAANAGLQRGDVILAVDGEPVSKSEEGFDRALIQAAMFGDGDTVTLTVQRGRDRDPGQVRLGLGGAAGCDGWRYGLLSQTPRIGYLRVPEFGGDADVNILAAIERMEEDAALDGLIVDVRHNPGGNADRSIAVFTEGIFGLVGPLRQDATQTTYRIRGPVRWNETTPVAVLTDGASHSAAEYFATAMKQSGRAVLVGMPTAGNTEGISGFSLPDGSLIRLAVMTLQLPDGRTLEGTGVIPDVRVPLGEWGLREVPDAQLAAAYEALALP
jgi:C-terminal peptidase prc